MIDKWYELLDDLNEEESSLGFSDSLQEQFYPFDSEYDYFTEIEKIDLDKEKVDDIKYREGFIIGPYKNIKKSLKDDDGLFSPRFGQTLQDMNTFIERYRCKCGNDKYKGRIYEGIRCEKCGEKVKYVGDNFEMFAWLELKKEYKIIHPNLYKTIDVFFGEGRLGIIINPTEIIDQDGKETGEKKKGKSPDKYDGIGMLDFVEHFDEILEYYHKKYPNKEDYYRVILENRTKIFARSIPVFTTHLRPFKLDNNKFYYNNSNDIYVMMSKLVHQINDDSLRIFRKKKPKNKLLFELQSEYNKLYKELEDICSGKKGTVRSLFGGRCNFTARNVIVPNMSLKLDEVTLSYYSATELLQQSIINILVKTYNMSYKDAGIEVYKATLFYNDRVYKIIKEIIANHKRGIPVLVNRNPTIVYGGITQAFIVDITLDYTLGVPLEVLNLFKGDFDGDALNVKYIINQEFFKYAYETYNPALNMVIDRNDGYLNKNVMPFKDTIINIQSFISLSRSVYTDEMKEHIKKMKELVY